MRFGSVYELQPGPGLGADSDRIVHVWREAATQVALMDQLGWDYVWEVEHHFLGDYSSSSAPESFLAYVAGQTSHIRLGHGVVLLPKEFNHAWRIAERIAALDILSNGRVEFGTGRGITRDELEGFGMVPDDSRAMQLEALEMLPQMWASDTFSWQGQFYNLPERRVSPRPVQRPHPPMWMAAVQPDSWRVAGERGLGVLSFGFSEPGLLEENIAVYREALKTDNPPSGMINDQIAIAPLMYCAETDTEAIQTAKPHLDFFVQCNIGFISQWLGSKSAAYEFYEKMAGASKPGEIFAMPKFEATKDIPGLSPDEAELAAQVRNGVFCVGSPQTCCDFVQLCVDAGIDNLFFPVQYGTLTHEQITRSIRLFSEEVIPKFAHPMRHAVAPQRPHGMGMVVG